MQRIIAIARRLRTDEDGYAASAIIAPVIFLLLFTALQGALWYQGTNVAQNAAVAAYNDARAYESTTGAGQASARQVLDQAGGFLQHSNVTVNRSADTVTVDVTGQAVSMIPGVQMPAVHRTITGPVERWVPAP
jgi:Flp pilus assembly protein TadG